MKINLPLNDTQTLPLDIDWRFTLAEAEDEENNLHLNLIISPQEQSDEALNKFRAFLKTQESTHGRTFKESKDSSGKTTFTYEDFNYLVQQDRPYGFINTCHLVENDSAFLDEFAKNQENRYLNVILKKFHEHDGLGLAVNAELVTDRIDGKLAIRLSFEIPTISGQPNMPDETAIHERQKTIVETINQFLISNELNYRFAVETLVWRMPLLTIDIARSTELRDSDPIIFTPAQTALLKELRNGGFNKLIGLPDTNEVTVAHDGENIIFCCYARDNTEKQAAVAAYNRLSSLIVAGNLFGNKTSLSASSPETVFGEKEQLDYNFTLNCHYSKLEEFVDAYKASIASQQIMSSQQDVAMGEVEKDDGDATMEPAVVVPRCSSTFHFTSDPSDKIQIDSNYQADPERTGLEVTHRIFGMAIEGIISDPENPNPFNINIHQKEDNYADSQYVMELSVPTNQLEGFLSQLGLTFTSQAAPPPNSTFNFSALRDSLLRAAGITDQQTEQAASLVANSAARMGASQ